MDQLEKEDNYIESESNIKPNNPIAWVIMIIGGFSRLLFWLIAIYIVISSCYFSFAYDNDLIMALLKLFFFPITYFVSPWFHGQWILLIISWIAYMVSTFLGLPPVE